MMSDDQNVPMDVTAMQAESIVKAAQSWAWSLSQREDPRMTEEEWVLWAALKDYGSEFKGLRAR